MPTPIAFIRPQARRPGAVALAAALATCLGAPGVPAAPSGMPAAAPAAGLLPAVPVADDESSHGSVAAEAAEPQALDTNALTSDHSINVPVAYWVYTNVSEGQINGYLAANDARLTEIEVYSVAGGVPRFTVRMVRNAGAYGVSGWGWWYNQTAADVQAKLAQNNGRLIDIEPYDAGGGVIRYAIVMVSNAGAAFRVSSVLTARTAAEIDAHIDATGHRLIDLDHYYIGGLKRYTAITVANVGSDAKAWQWYLNQTPAQVSARVAAFNGRIVKLDRQPDGRYHLVQVKNTGSNASAWWLNYNFTTITSLLNYASQLAIRPVDIVTFVDAGGQRRYTATFIDNASAATRRVRSAYGEAFLTSTGGLKPGIFQAYLRRIDGVPGVRVSLNAGRRAETASSLKSLHLLHAMRRVMFGQDTLNSSFNYWDYIAGTETDQKNACPNPALETNANLQTNFNFEGGLDNMMSISDNRTTRGTVVRYGGFAPFNGTAGFLGLTGTTLRHNIGCAYRNLANGKYEPTNFRNDTTAEDLARIYEGVWTSTFLNNTNAARSEFLESSNLGTGVSADLQTIINQEAAKLGKLGIAAQFGAAVQRWGKGGSYGTCLPNGAGNCGTKVIVRSGTGLIRLPVKNAFGATLYRTYSFARLISDVPVTDWDAADATAYIDAYSNAANEMYRDEIRSALLTW